MDKQMEKSVSKKVQSWRWRTVKACGTMEKFCEETGRPQSQLSEWLNGKKTPTQDSIDSMEKDLKARGA